MILLLTSLGGISQVARRISSRCRSPSFCLTRWLKRERDGCFHPTLAECVLQYHQDLSFTFFWASTMVFEATNMIEWLVISHFPTNETDGHIR